MALSSLEIAAIFAIEDQATPAFRRIAESAKALAAELKNITREIQGDFEAKFKAIGVGIAAQQKADIDGLRTAWTGLTAGIKTNFTTTFSEIDGIISAQARQLNILKASLAQTVSAAGAGAVAAGAVGGGGAAPWGNYYTGSGVPLIPVGGGVPPGGPGGGGVPPGGGGRRGLGRALGMPAHSPQFYQGLQVGTARAHITGGPAMGLFGLGAYSVYEAFEVPSYVSKTLSNAFPDEDQSKRTEEAAELTKIINDTAITIGASPIRTAQMALDEVRSNTMMPWKDRLEVLPAILKASAKEAYLKNMNNPELAVNSVIGQLHQAGKFDKQGIMEYLNTIAYFNSKDPNAVNRIAVSEAYHMPIDTSAMHVPEAQELAAQTVLDQMGVGGKAGTWIRQMVLRAALPSTLENDKKYANDIKRLKFMGLAESVGGGRVRSTITDEQGNYDTQKMLHILSEKQKNLTVDERKTFGNDLAAVFGTRGMESITPLIRPGNLERYDAYLKEEKEHRGIALDQWWAQTTADNPMMQMRTTLSTAQVLLYDIGTKGLPVFTGALQSLKSVLDIINKSPTGDRSSSGEDERRKALGRWGLWGGLGGLVVGGVPGAALGTILGGTAGYGAEAARQVDKAAPAGTDLKSLQDLIDYTTKQKHTTDLHNKSSSLGDLFIGPANAEEALSTTFSDRFVAPAVEKPNATWPNTRGPGVPFTNTIWPNTIGPSDNQPSFSQRTWPNTTGPSDNPPSFNERFWPNTTGPGADTRQNQSYNVVPSSQQDKKPIITTAVLNIDGQQLAQTIASKLADIYENSPSASTGNGVAYFMPDINPIM